MKFIDYLKDKITFLITYLILIAIITGLLLLFNSNVYLVIYIFSVTLITGIVMLWYNYYRKKEFYNGLKKTISELDQKYLIIEIIKDPNFLEGKILYDSLYDIDKSMIEKLNKYKHNSEEFKEYIEMWCHEIKTPLATGKMIIENNKNDVTNNIDEELTKIENYIEQVLYYARSGSVEKDYIIKETDINNVINLVINKNKKDIRNKKIKLDVNIKDSIVNSDSKWLEFIINQIIVNSIKYSNKTNPLIKISTIKNKNNIELIIEDNGIGIEANELDRVFDKGFTGSNGRKKYNSTGIGLYLCKQLCNKLEHGIIIESIINKGTTLKLVFPLGNMSNIMKK